LAEGYCRTKKIKAKDKKPFFWISVAANNFPDLDFLYTTSKAMYLVHHRGFTHTFLMHVPQAFIILALTFMFCFKNDQKRSWFHQNKFQIFLLALVGQIIHVSMDFWNSYGVHPFAPFSANWFYGDTFFIIEPLLWIIIG